MKAYLKINRFLYGTTLFILFFNLQVFQANGEEVGKSEWTDLKTSVGWLFEASFKQFITKSNIYASVPLGAALWYSFEEDERITKLATSKDESGLANLVGDLAIVASFPIIPVFSYYWGKSIRDGDTKLIQFSMETLSAMYLALLESGILSHIDIQTRPNSNVNFWEKAFRGKSSFPSGHIVPFSVLTFKTLQFYGPVYAILPATLLYLTGYQRVQEGKHYLSDVVGGFILSFFASEGVRFVSAYEKNHPIYKFIFEHDLKVSLIRKDSGIGPLITFTF
jgi:membrane-associated phospholipid phosphatase